MSEIFLQFDSGRPIFEARFPGLQADHTPCIVPELNPNPWPVDYQQKISCPWDALTDWAIRKLLWSGRMYQSTQLHSCHQIGGSVNLSFGVVLAQTANNLACHSMSDVFFSFLFLLSCPFFPLKLSLPKSNQLILETFLTFLENLIKIRQYLFEWRC